MNRKQRRKAKKKNVMTRKRVREVVNCVFEAASDESGRVDMQKLLEYGGAEVDDIIWQIVWRRSPDNSALVMLTSTPYAPGRWGSAIITINDGELAVETSVHKGCPARL